jgi:pyroglutamyl-peptidase
MAGPLLITGFGPFPGVPRNPSAALARRIGALARPKTGGIPVRVLILRTTYAAIPSRDAGRYLCNATYFRALRDTPPALFVHIPLPPRTPRPVKAPVKAAARPLREAPGERLARACTEVARRLVVHGRRPG